MKERLKTDRRAESRFVNVGACELLRILRCIFNGYIVPFHDNLRTDRNDSAAKHSPIL